MNTEGKHADLLWLKSKSILGLILLLSFFLRSYHLDFPSIGYHNMKENEYLSIAEEMLRTKDVITKRVYFYNAFEDVPTMKIYPQPPMISYQILISWKLLGKNLWGPRLFNVIFGVLSILVSYLICLLLIKNSNFSLFCAFLLAIMPVGVFFSRNLQPESPAFFFMLLGNLFYLKFASSLKKYNLFLGGLSFSIAWLYKFTFLIGILPIIFCFHFRKIYKERDKFLKYFLVFLLPYLLIFISILWLKHTGQWTFQELGRVKLFEIFSFTYWEKYGHTIWWYIMGENYSPIFTLLIFLGMVIAFIKREELLNHYIIAWTLAIIPYSMFFSDFINQHNYYQIPFLGLVCLSSTYAMAFISGQIKKFLKKNLFKYFVILIVIISTASVYPAIARMYGTIFLGEDIAGESLKEFTSSDERVVLYTHCQGYGIARYAQRYAGRPSSLEEFKKMEEKFKIRYVCIYPADYLLSLKDNAVLLNYLQESYRIKELGLTNKGNQLNYYYVILEKGEGLSDIKKFVSSNIERIRFKKTYRVLDKSLSFYTIRAM